MDRAFAPVQIGTVGDVGVLVFVAQGEINWHRHIDEDEIFFDARVVRSKSTRSWVIHFLRVGEALLIPKGVAHHSGAIDSAIVLLFRQQVMPERKNGHRKHLATGEEPPLKKIRFADVLSDSTPDYQPMKVAAMESHAMTVFTARGSGIEEESKTGGTMLYALYGELEIKTGFREGVTRTRADDFSATPDSLQTTCREERDCGEVREGISHTASDHPTGKLFAHYTPTEEADDRQQNNGAQ